MEPVGPTAVVLVSSWQVYSADAGEDIDETRPLWATGEAGKSKARMEREFEEWCRAREIPLTVVRPARMFGNGVKGEMARLFDKVVAGRYVHIRGNEAKVSLVTALDCALAIVALLGKEGIYNVSDGTPHRWVDLCEAMSANAGEFKRMPRLPEKWAATIWKLFPRVPIVQLTLSPEALRPYSVSQTLATDRLRAAVEMRFHNTLDVIAHRDSDYPYEQ